MGDREWTPEQILAAMTLLGLTRGQMAYILDVSNLTTVGRLINGRTKATAKRMVQLDTMMRVANILRAQAKNEREAADKLAT